MARSEGVVATAGPAMTLKAAKMFASIGLSIGSSQYVLAGPRSSCYHSWIERNVISYQEVTARFSLVGHLGPECILAHGGGDIGVVRGLLKHEM
ncbi:uncharacterized protein PHACADRAFT_262736 [Phanerochaete carnosa HHB-10118-sp]|uniref:Uncharacterized protein n=1 Tax=Phanerochaete carnosa (strain HHB-10118-sp) TaxID=650164 RepID=K5VHY3_PHACS|nr:uncharacterized protein PHACADRAFT_262736 [Phanerochaete carnosa HHB-10118-sp]EKM50858.1 hypothetical protein PHACADRAFT_262736 [Phanerochaete carnosa HHB-10118-sp]